MYCLLSSTPHPILLLLFRSLCVSLCCYAGTLLCFSSQFTHTHAHTHTRTHAHTHAHTDTHVRACAHTTCLNAHYYTCPTTSHVFPCSVVHSCTQPCLLLLNSMDMTLLSLLQIESTLMRTSRQAAALLCLDIACPHPSPGATSVWGYRLVGAIVVGGVMGDWEVGLVWWEV